MDQLIILASPRKKGTSAMLCETLQKKNGGEIVHLFGDQSVVDKCLKAQVITIIGPCYINSYPGDVVALLCQLAQYQTQLAGKKMYAVIQGGMPYMHTHDHGIKMIERFCNTMHMHYMGGFVLGGGPILDGKPLNNLPFNGKKAAAVFDQFATHVSLCQPTDDSLYQSLEMPIKGPFAWGLAKFLSHMKIKQLRQKGINPNEKSPYARS